MKDTRTSLTTPFWDTAEENRHVTPLRANHSTLVSLGMLLLLGLAALHFSWLVFRWGAEAHQLFLGNVLYIAPTFVAALVTLAAALKQQGKSQRGWLLISLSLIARSLSVAASGATWNSWRSRSPSRHLETSST